MAMVVNTNIMSLNAQRNLNGTQNSLSTSMERLSSGLRINSAKDDAAGLAISDRMSSQVRGLNQSVRNANDAISLSQTAEGAMQESTNILQRMRELSVQSANDSNGAADRANLQKEIVQMQAELDRIASTTTFNGKNLFDGTFSSQKFHVGANANETISVSIGAASAADMGTNQVASTEGYNAAATNALAADADGLTIVGTTGSATTAATALGASAKAISDAINAVQSSTGVSSDARTEATLTAAAGSVSFTLEGKNEGAAVTIAANVVSAADLSGLADAINAKASTTGITAVSSGASITMVNEQGYDVSITNGAGAPALTMDGNAVAAAASGTVYGAVTMSAPGAFSFEDAEGGLATILGAATGSSALTAVSTVDVGSQSGAETAIDIIDGALQFIADTRADLGAVQNRLSSTISNLQNVSENVSAARSRVMDADFAAETANMTRSSILQQAGVAMLSQANSQPQMVLSLLQ
ncbi:MAG: hypothetical protein OI74_09700 [Gammaproteobacteria bacterium (ex Lamellibrachia satsuma)]|nr:MAG: flagellin [Gammaproteobacteria bacterium (ex Lamellibrachia satsuma)]RRS32946.1 MAG: hypothetical protein OI74_09700 [Gammaproteobacteria bacterium (ex Lamellibrachia satsuma)]RRS34061.1 MAG: hypothetical protein NV67_14535 [Gammaproteobacteria bacterium (ex Lamellibrachia satsuma)]